MPTRPCTGHVGHHLALRIEDSTSSNRASTARCGSTRASAGVGHQGGRLVARRLGDDIEQHGQLVVELLGRAVDQRRLLAQQHLREVVAHVLVCTSVTRRSSGSRSGWWPARLCLDAERLHDFL
jgi:hypothetical protein